MASPPSALRVAVLACSLLACTLAYRRPPPRGALFVPLADDADRLTPQQVHVSLVGEDRVRITWITEDDGPSVVEYGSQYSLNATGSSDTYSYLLYRSGHIHDVVTGPLSPSTVYDYRLGTNSARDFSLKTPPKSLPFKFAVVGDLGQTEWTGSTLNHLAAADYDVLLLPGDLSYADMEQPLWDSLSAGGAAGELPAVDGDAGEPRDREDPPPPTEKVHRVRGAMAHAVRRRPSHRLRLQPLLLLRCRRRSHPRDHARLLRPLRHGSPQQMWLAADLARLERRRPQWVVAVIHAPWYNSNDAHREEGEEMRQELEAMLYEARVDVVFAGHVHAYERFERVFNGSSDLCGPVHITIGDGGNREGLATQYQDPQPAISLFREASFGHGRFEVANATHALWTWHRNDDGVAATADQVWITSLASDTACQRKR